MFSKTTILAPVLAAALALLGAPSTGVAAEAKKSDKLASADETFVREAASGGIMEVEMGKAAAGKGTHPRVKEFGQRMLEDHGKANEELKSIASDKGVKLPSSPMGKHKQNMDKLMKLSGAEFDREYMHAMVNAHKEDVQKFKQQADQGKDPDIKAFASKHAPILEEHLKMAQEIDKEVGKGGKAGASGTTKGTGSATKGTAR